MEHRNKRIFYFSPTGSCRAFARGIAMPDDGLSDLTSPDARAEIPSFSPSDECAFFFPVYNGRIPEACAAFLGKCRGNGARVFLFCVYGGAHKGKSLSEGAELLRERAFIPIGGGYLPAPHAYTKHIKNAVTQERISKFAAFLRGECAGTLIPIADRAPNTQIQKRMKPLTGKCRLNSEKCLSCGKCREICPVAAIGNAFRADKNCILCGACVSVCPTRARKLSLTPFTKLFLRISCKEREDEFYTFPR